MLRILIVLFLVMVDLAFPSSLDQIKQNGVMKVGMEVGCVPFEMKNKKGEVVGFDVDVINNVASVLGVKTELINTSFDGLIAGLLAKKYDVVISCMAVTDDRKKMIDFSNPYKDSAQTMVVKNKHKNASVADLNSKRFTIGVKLGETGEMVSKDLFAKAHIKKYEDLDVMMLDLINGRIDAYIYDEPSNEIFVNTKGKGLFHNQMTLLNEPIAIGVRKGETDLLYNINLILKQMGDTGKLESLNNKWFVNLDYLNEL